jgi:hypothetical protein
MSARLRSSEASSVESCAIAPQRQGHLTKGRDGIIILGIVLLILGVTGVGILWSIGTLLVVIGAILWIPRSRRPPVRVGNVFGCSVNVVDAAVWACGGGAGASKLTRA